MPTPKETTPTSRRVNEITPRSFRTIRGNAIESGLSTPLNHCLQRHLQQLAARSQAGRGDQAYGFYCLAAEQSVIGAGTVIRRSGGSGPEQGWLLHFSRIQRPSYNAAVNQAFSRINASLSTTADQGGTAAPAVSELLPANQVLTLKPAVPRWQQRWLAAEGAAPEWMGGNALVGAAAEGTLLRQELPGPLLNRSELLLAISQSDGAPETSPADGLWIAALQVKVMLFRDAIRQQGEAKNKALAWLGERLQQREPTRHLALGENNTLLQVIRPLSSDAREEQLLIEGHL